MTGDVLADPERSIAGSSAGAEEAGRRELQRLRRDYPNWGFLVIEHVWVAVRGKTITVNAETPARLRAALPPAPADPPAAPALATVCPQAAEPALPGAMTYPPTTARAWADVVGLPATTRSVRRRRPGRRRLSG